MNQELLLIYHLDDETRHAIETIMKQLDVRVQNIENDQINDNMGYLIGIDGFEKGQEKADFIMRDEFLFFVGFQDEQIELVLDIFQQANIKYIPFKAKLTQDNVGYPFFKVYEYVKEEYETLTMQKDHKKKEA